MPRHPKPYSDTIRRPGWLAAWKPKKFQHYKTIKELGIALQKDPGWLRRLERRGTIPRPTVVKRGQIEYRLYSPELEEEIREILKTLRSGVKL